MNKLASLTGYTPGSASVTFGNIKRKIKLLGEGLAANGPATPKNGSGAGRAKATPKSSGKRTAKAAAAGSDEEEAATPSKRPKKNSAKKPRRNADDDDDEEFASFGNIKKEELNDITTSADDFYAQAHQAAGYGYPDES